MATIRDTHSRIFFLYSDVSLTSTGGGGAEESAATSEALLANRALGGALGTSDCDDSVDDDAYDMSGGSVFVDCDWLAAKRSRLSSASASSWLAAAAYALS